MVVKLFVLGLPGSGKSSVARLISMHARDRHWSTMHFNDYPILYEMYQENKKGQFKPAEFGGFDILDLTVFDLALKKLEQEVNRHISSSKSEEFILIEFARNDYQQAFHQFSDEFLQNANFLYLGADLNICKRRISGRITKPIYDGDHYVSDYIFKSYYCRDNGRSLPGILERDYMLDKQRVCVVDNNCSLEEVSNKFEPFIDALIRANLKLASTSVNGFKGIVHDVTANMPVLKMESFILSNKGGDIR